MSDLQCAATLLITRSAGTEDPEPARHLADSLRTARVAKVYCSERQPAVRTAQTVAGLLGLPAEARPGLGPRAERETEQDVLARVGAELEGIADQHRGETVLVVSHGEVICLVVPSLAHNLPPGFWRRMPGAGRVTEVAADADGWAVRTWDGRPLAADDEPIS